MVDGLVRRIKAESGEDCTVVATGGLAAIIAEAAQTIDVVDPMLTLKGLRGIYARNTKDAAL